MQLFQLLGCVSLLASMASACAAAPMVSFDARSVRNGNWSDPDTWTDRRVPRAGGNVQIRSGHVVTYDVDSDSAVRVLHVAGTLAFARDKSTRLDVGLLKIQPGEECAEEGFNCHEVADLPASAESKSLGPALELGTPENPIPSNVTARIRLVYFEGMDPTTLPAIVNCGGRWDVHGAPMNRTWLKLGQTAKPRDSKIVLAVAVTNWKVGDRVIVTASKQGSEYSPGYQSDPTFQERLYALVNRVPGNPYSLRKQRRLLTEERFITALDGATLTLDQPLAYEHYGTGEYRSEVANLSRNVIIESAAPDGVRGHTMYHLDSAGGISYAEFRHLGKGGVLGKYAIHFHLVRDSMRGRGVLGASIWDSHNRWITIHGTDFLLVRDCVGYQSAGHGFFLEDATEQYNVLDRNLAVQAFRARRLPKQALPFDANDGAGFWWANGRNTFTRNVACENDQYGFRFEIARRSDFNPELRVRQPDGTVERRDVRAIPFLRFEDNESHSEGLYSFNFGDDAHPSVRGDRQHPFIARGLKAWETHYALRPNVQFLLVDGLDVHQAAYGVYHPDYDAQVYRNIRLRKINAEPINRGHDDESIQYGTFTYENVTLENCRVGRDPLIQLACTSPSAGQAGHFRNLVLLNNDARQGQVVDLGGGPRNDKLEFPVAYYFHGLFGSNHATKVVSARFAGQMTGENYRSIEHFTGRDVRAADVSGVAFPKLLEPMDDLPPATMITSVRRTSSKLHVRGLTQDDGEIASVRVNGHLAAILSGPGGVAEWEIVLERSRLGSAQLTARAVDRAGNRETRGHQIEISLP